MPFYAGDVISTNIIADEFISSSLLNAAIINAVTAINSQYITASIALYSTDLYTTNTIALGQAAYSTGLYSFAQGDNVYAIGDFSFAQGFNVYAIGTASYAHGLETRANGPNSHAEGFFSKTSIDAEYSHAEGQVTMVSGSAAHAEGSYTTAQGNAAHAEGQGTSAGIYWIDQLDGSTARNGDYSHAEGWGCITEGNSSHAEGYYTTAYGANSHTEGYYTYTGIKGYDCTVSSGVITISSNYGNCTASFTGETEVIVYIGSGPVKTQINTTIPVSQSLSGNTVFVLADTSINGTGYIAPYNITPVSGSENPRILYPQELIGGFTSHAEGYGSRVYSNHSHAEGYYTKTFGDSSHAEGSGSITYGKSSHAEGIGTVTYGTASHASGLYTVASGSYQTVIGQYNKQNNTTDLFVIGAGTINDRKDVFNVSTNSVTISGSLNVSGSINGTFNGTISTASYYLETDPIFTAVSGTFATNISLNNFTSSYYLDSSSFNNKINDLINATSSYVTNSQTSSFITNNQTSSFVINSQTSSFVTNSQTSSFVLNSQTSSFVINSQTSSMSVGSASYTPNAIVTASVSSNTLTFTKGNNTQFSLIVNTGSAVTILPGGSTDSIQYNDGAGGFGGDTSFLYNTSNKRIGLETNIDVYSIPVDTTQKSSFRFQNSNKTPKSTTFSQNIFTYTPDTIAANSTAIITTFSTHTADFATLDILSFKCDYTLVIWDGSKWSGTRMGILTGAWDYDESETPTLVDSSVSGDKTLGLLDDVLFSLAWNGSNQIELSIDNSLNSQDIAFTGLFTTFNARY